MRRLLLLLLRAAPWLTAGLLLLVLVLLNPASQRTVYWLNLSRQYFIPAALALALTPIILTGGIDLSVGSATVLSSVVLGALWRDAGWPIAWAVAGGVLTGLLAGLGNGLLVNAGVLPLVATLATRALYRGLAQTLSGSTPASDFPVALATLWNARPLGLPGPLLVLALLALLTWLLVHHTWMGRMLFAVGDNERAARFAGVPVARLTLALYAGSGLMAGLCGVAEVMQYDVAKADVETSLELTAIACVVLGGLRVTGGAGHVAGTLLGTLTVAVLLTGLYSAGATARDTLTGVILVAVAISNEAAARWAARLEAASETDKH